MKNNFKKYRLRMGWTQAEVAEKLHVSRASYVHYETGESEPSFEVLKTISHLFHASIDQLLDNHLDGEFDRIDIQAFVDDIQEVCRKHGYPFPREDDQ